MQICGVIPAFNPGDIINEVIDKTLQHVNHLILVDDGCDLTNADFLKQYSDHPKITLITHSENQGKGFALHTGFAHFLTRTEPYLVMLDSDGQHDPAEIQRFKHYCQNKSTEFVMGVRSEIEKMPLKSKIGNISMSKLFLLTTKQQLSDTQSGFRLLSRNFIKSFLSECKPGRYETEMKMLFLAAKIQEQIEQVPITTTYINNNSNSKYRPLKDSFRILSTFFKFASVSVISFLVDFLIYISLLSLNVNFLHAHIASRSISGILNYTLNRKMVFKNKDSILKTAAKYMLAVLISMAISSVLLWLMVTPANWSATWSKPIAELMTFILNFFVVKHFVFQTKNNDS